MKLTAHSGRGTRLLVVCALCGFVGGCQSSAQTGALAGGGMGALIGQAAGGSTEATLIGAAAGAGIGYVIGNEKDKQDARAMSQGRQSQYYPHDEVGPLGGTRWMVVSLVSRKKISPYASKVVEFGPRGQVTTTTTRPDGSWEIRNERYRVVGKTLIVNMPGYMINATYGIDGDHLIVDAPAFRAVLKRL